MSSKGPDVTGSSSSYRSSRNADNLSGMAVYRVTEAFLANDCHGSRLVTVKKGSLLAICGQIKQFGLIEATCADQRLLVFARDLAKCTECIERKPIGTERHSSSLGCSRPNE